jgi:hypothetical protein
MTNSTIEFHPEEEDMRVPFIALTLLAASIAAPASAAQTAAQLFMANKDIMALIEKAKADRKDNAPLVAEPILSMAPYRAQLEYRPGTSPAAVHEKDADHRDGRKTGR